MAKRKAEYPPASWADILGPGGIVGFFNPADPKIKKSRERAAKKVEKEFARILNAFRQAEQDRKLRKLINKLAQSQSEESP
jgi:hypothetical protein